MRLILTDGKGVRVYDCMHRAYCTVAEMLLEVGQALTADDVEWLRTQDYQPLVPTQPQPTEKPCTTAP